MNKYIDKYIEEIAESLSDSTVRGHRSTLNNFIKSLDNVSEPIEVTVRDVVQYRNNEYEVKKVGTVNTMLKRVKQFFDWCIGKGYMDISPADSVKLLTEGEMLPKWLDEKQEDLLIKAIKRKYLGVSVKNKSYRELAIVYVMLKAGLRVGEVSEWKWEEIQIVGDRGKTLVRGKDQQQRTVPLIPDVVEVLKQYDQLHGRKGEYVFHSQRSDKISVRGIQKILSGFKEVQQGDVSLHDLTPHKLRHTFAHNLAKKGMAIESIARLMGHMKKNGEPNTQQTIRYTKASQDEIGEEMERILGMM